MSLSGLNGRLLLTTITLLCAAYPTFCDIIYVDDDASGTDTGASWTDAYRSLQDALADARDAAEPPEIRVAQGTYRLDQGRDQARGDKQASFLLVSGVIVKGGFAGTGHADPDLRDATLFTTRLSGDLAENDLSAGRDERSLSLEPWWDDNSCHVVVLNGTDPGAVLDGVTISGGCADGEQGDSGYGGGLFNASGSPTIRSCVIRDNVARLRGGGMYSGPFAEPTVVETRFERNDVMSPGPLSGGGGVCNDQFSCPQFRACTFQANRQLRKKPSIFEAWVATWDDAGGGGAVLNLLSGGDFQDCVFLRNTGYNGAGVANVGVAALLVPSQPHLSDMIEQLDPSAQLDPIEILKQVVAEGQLDIAEIMMLLAAQGRLDLEALIEQAGATLNIDEAELLGALFAQGIVSWSDLSGVLLGRETWSQLIARLITEGDIELEAILQMAGLSDTTEFLDLLGWDLFEPFLHCDPTFVRCGFAGNRASIGGGAIVNFLGANTHVINTGFWGNQACFGGGVLNAVRCAPTLVNCVFSGNVAGFNGGAFHCYAQDTPDLINCTMGHNVAHDYGGAIHLESGSRPTLSNCILWGNQAPNGPEIAMWTALQPTTIAVQYSDVQGGIADVYMNDPCCAALWGPAGIVDSDPIFIDPDGLDAVIGTPDDNLRLSYGSPCVDAGRNRAVPTDQSDLDDDGDLEERLPVDFDGWPRFVADDTAQDSGEGPAPVIDLGAYEAARAVGGIRVSHPVLGVPEGETATFRVKVVGRLREDVQVFVAHQSGDPDIRVISGSVLIFTASDQMTEQEVVLEAVRDADFSNGTAIFSVTDADGHGMCVTATESDSQAGPEVLFVDHRAPSRGTGRTWKSALPDLQSALLIARQCRTVKEIQVACGVYKPSSAGSADRERSFDLVDGVALYGGFPSEGGDRDPETYVTILSGDTRGNDAGAWSIKWDETSRQDNVYHVVTASGIGTHTVLDGFVIEGGYASGSLPGTNSGGGLFTHDANVVVANCKLRDNGAWFGGAMYSYGGDVTLQNCTVERNLAEGWGGGLACYQGRVTLESCHLYHNEARGFSYNSGSEIFSLHTNLVVREHTRIESHSSYLWDLDIQETHLIIEGQLELSDTGWWLSQSSLTGPGTLKSDHRSHINCWGDVTIESNVQGPGTDIRVYAQASLTVGGQAHVDLGDGQQTGYISCDGLLRLRDNAHLSDAVVQIACASFEDSAILDNCVVQAELDAPFGQFFIQDDAHLWLDKIEANGDRYLDLDPTSFDCNNIHVNFIGVTITEGAGQARGGLFELRGCPIEELDQRVGILDCGPNGFVCTIERAPDFGPDSWTLDKLTLATDAKLNLTNRFDFHAPFESGGDHEVLYVRELVLGPNSVLNTAYNWVYCETLLQEDASARIVNVPLLGFSLNTIAFDEASEFEIRVRSNNHTTESGQAHLERIHAERVVGLAADANGVMRLRCLKERDPHSPRFGLAVPARAKGWFDKSSEDRILVMFDYLFETDDSDFTPEDPNVELIVYLSDVPELQEPRDPNHHVEVSRLRPPRQGRPGAAGSGQFGRFHRYVYRRGLDFVRGTRVELELIGPEGTSVLINDWDPQIQCPQMCMDFDGSHTIDYTDLIPIIGELGQPAELDGQGGNECADSPVSCDGGVDAFDIAGWEWALDNSELLNLCPQATRDGEDHSLPLTDNTNAPTSAGSASRSTGVDRQLSATSAGFESEALLISGKSSWNVFRDGFDAFYDHVKMQNLYTLNHQGQCLDSTALSSARRVARLVRGSDDQIYMTCVGTGVVRLLEGGASEVVLPSGQDYSVASEPRYGQIARVRAGLHVNGAGVWGRPIWDVAVRADGLYVVPVVVVPAFDEAYLAAARLVPSVSHSSGYEVAQLYDHSRIFNRDDPSRPQPFFDPDNPTNPHLGGLREIEVDAAGNVYVLNAQSRFKSDALWRHPPTGGAPELVSLTDPHIPNPIGLCVSDKDGMVYVASGRTSHAAGGSAAVHGFSITDLTPQCEIRIDGMQQVSDLTKDPSTGDIWVVGFTLNAQRLWDPASYGEVTESFYEPCLAKVSCDPKGASDVVSVPIVGHCDLALPLSIVWTATE